MVLGDKSCRSWLAEHGSKASEVLKREITTDRQHLQGLEFTSGPNADVLLCATDENRLIGFPVHGAYVALHSPVIAEILGATSIDEELQQQQLRRLPLLDDNYSLYSAATIRAAVGHLYRSFPQTACKSSATTSIQIDLDTLSMQATCLSLYHKYGMVNMNAQQQYLEKPLETFLSQTSSDNLSDILEFASDAEASDCSGILKTCEAYLARHSQAHGWQQAILSSKLSRASISRIYEHVIKKQRQDMQAMQTVHADENQRRQDVETAAQVAQQRLTMETQVLCKSLFYHGMRCPRCNGGMKLSKKKNVMHASPNSTCRWPRFDASVQ